jgi:hypothetical protein
MGASANRAGHWPRLLGLCSLAVVLLLLTAGCAGLKSATTTATTTYTAPPPAPGPVTKAAACNLHAGRAESRCRASYAACAASAKAEVTAYAGGNAPPLDTLATGYAKSTYGILEATWRPAYGGCMAALRAEFDRLYGG